MAAIKGGRLKSLADSATLSKKELTQMEKDAERRTADRKKLKESTKKAPANTRRARVQARRTAEKNIPKRVRDMMVSEAQDAKNKGDAKLRSETRGNTRGVQKPAPKGTLRNITDATARTASRIGAAAKLLTGAGALLASDEVGRGSDVVPEGRRDEFVRKMDAKREAAKATTKKKDAPAATAKTSGGAGSRTVKSGDTLSAIAKQAGVTLKQLLAANPQIKDANKIRPGQKIKLPKATIKGTGKSIYAAGGGMVKANCGASMKPTQKSSRGTK